MQALPTQIKWVREGLLIIGLDTEMQVYSQWSSLNNKTKKSITPTPPDSTTPNSSQKQLQDNKDELDSASTTTKYGEEKKLASLIIPKNHSVMDLNKLNKLTKETTSNNKNNGMSLTKKNSLKEAEDELDFGSAKKNQKSNSITSAGVKSSESTTTRFFDETELLEIVQDSGLFMQAKYNLVLLD
jgi:hypothetical protein